MKGYTFLLRVFIYFFEIQILPKPTITSINITGVIVDGGVEARLYGQHFMKSSLLTLTYHGTITVPISYVSATELVIEVPADLNHVNNNNLNELFMISVNQENSYASDVSIPYHYDLIIHGKIYK